MTEDVEKRYYLPELKSCFRVTEDGAHIIDFYHPYKETHSQPKGTRIVTKAELVCTLKQNVNKKEWKPVYVADLMENWIPVLDIMNALHLTVNTDF